MDIEKSKLILALLLINKGDALNNSYKLMRILEWKFRVIDSKRVLDQIKENHYAEYEIINGVHYYKLASEGRKLINQEYSAALNFLLKTYPKEADIITSLFSPRPCLFSRP